MREVPRGTGQGPAKTSLGWPQPPWASGCWGREGGGCRWVGCGWTQAVLVCVRVPRRRICGTRVHRQRSISARSLGDRGQAPAPSSPVPLSTPRGMPCWVRCWARRWHVPLALEPLLLGTYPTMLSDAGPKWYPSRSPHTPFDGNRLEATHKGAGGLGLQTGPCAGQQDAGRTLSPWGKGEVNFIPHTTTGCFWIHKRPLAGLAARDPQ